MRNQKLLIGMSLSVLALGSFLLTGCDKFTSHNSGAPGAPGGAAAAGPPGQPPPKPPEVLVGVPTLAEVTDYEDFTGRTMAKPTIDIRPRVTGYLDKIYFNEGADVKEGDMLYEIDPRPYQSEVDRTQGVLSQAEAHLNKLNADMQRAKVMMPNHTISQEQYDQVAGDQAEAQAAIGTAQASLDLAKLNLGYTKIKAPISGRMSRTMYDQGNLVKADDTVLTTIVALQPIYATFGVDERLLQKVHNYVANGMLKTNDKGQVPVLMALVNEDAFPHAGIVSFIDNHLDTGTGSLEVRGEFANADGHILPGLYARIRLPLGQPHQALTIPNQAISSDQDKKFVYIVDDQNKIVYRPVEVGREQNKQRVILQGINAGDRVVVVGLQRVRPGVTVDPKPYTPTTASN